MLECLQRALRVADACMDTAVSVELFVEILNRYVFYFDQQNETVSSLSADALPLLKDHPGYDEIHQWTHRAHPLQPANQSRKLFAGSSQATLPKNSGLHIFKGIRRGSDPGEIRSESLTRAFPTWLACAYSGTAYDGEPVRSVEAPCTLGGCILLEP